MLVAIAIVVCVVVRKQRREKREKDIVDAAKMRHSEARGSAGGVGVDGTGTGGSGTGLGGGPMSHGDGYTEDPFLVSTRGVAPPVLVMPIYTPPPFMGVGYGGENGGIAAHVLDSQPVVESPRVMDDLGMKNVGVAMAVNNGTIQRGTISRNETVPSPSSTGGTVPRIENGAGTTTTPVDTYGRPLKSAMKKQRDATAGDVATEDSGSNSSSTGDLLAPPVPAKTVTIHEDVLVDGEKSGSASGSVGRKGRWSPTMEVMKGDAIQMATFNGTGEQLRRSQSMVDMSSSTASSTLSLKKKGGAKKKKAGTTG
ncbi:hypothetical protein HDU99_006381, partial [Rhizoclosmatium hyalinum]